MSINQSSTDMKLLFIYLNSGIYFVLGLYFVFALTTAGVIMFDTLQSSNSDTIIPNDLKSVAKRLYARNLNSFLPPQKSSIASEYPESISRLLNSSKDLYKHSREYSESSVDGEKSATEPNIFLKSSRVPRSAGNRVMKLSEDLNAFDEFVDLLTTSTRTVCHAKTSHDSTSDSSVKQYHCFVLTNTCIPFATTKITRSRRNIHNKSVRNRCSRHLSRTGYDVQPIATEKERNSDNTKLNSELNDVRNNKRVKTRVDTDVRRDTGGKEAVPTDLTEKMIEDKNVKTRDDGEKITTADQNNNDKTRLVKVINTIPKERIFEDEGMRESNDVPDTYDSINGFSTTSSSSLPDAFTLTVDTRTSFQSQLKEIIVHTSAHTSPTVHSISNIPPHTLKLAIVLDLAGLNSLHKYEIISKFLKVSIYVPDYLITRGIINK